MKELVLSLWASLLFVGAIAQKEIPKFGEIEKLDLKMKECDFDKNAEALVLFDVGEFFCNIYYQSVSKTVFVMNERHIRIKILKDKGLSRADIHIRYHSFANDERVKGIIAQTYNLDADGSVIVSKLDKKLIYYKEINKRYSEVVFSLPEVKVGSIIEYKYIVEGSGSNNWYFQKSIPVMLSRYTINVPIELEIACIQHCTLPVSSLKNEKGGKEIQTFSMEKIPALRNEAFISCEEDYLQSLEPKLIAVNMPGSYRKSLLKTWPRVINELMEDEDFGMQLKKNIPRTSDLDAMLKDVNSSYKKMLIIYDYVRQNMQWDGYDNIWALNGVKSAWKDKKGTSGEINLILINLLKDAGLTVYPVLVSTLDNGRVNTAMAGYSQFNKVLAYVVIDEKVYVLNAVDKYTPANLIPQDVITTEGLVIEKIDTQEWGWRTLWNGTKLFTNNVFLQAEINSNGDMKGEVIVNSQDYARVKRTPKLKEGKKAFIEKYFTSQNHGVKIDSVSIENENTDSLPLKQTIRFNQTLDASGDYRYFTANMFSGLEKNPFVADERFSDIFFGYNQHITIVGNFAIPENYQFEELPKNIRMMMPDTGIVFTRITATDENRLSVRISLDFKRPVYSIDEYPAFKEFYKKLYDMLNEQFVIKKKS